MDIVVLDGYTINPGDVSWEGLDRFGTVTVYDRTKPEELAPRVAGADIVISCKIRWGKTAFAAAPKLRLVAIASTGYDAVDLDEARAHGVSVANVPAYSTPDVAQLTFSLILEFCFHAGEHSRGVSQGRWVDSQDFCYWDFPLIELAGKTLGIVGMGSIGYAVSRIARAFGMDVLFNNRSPKPELEDAHCHQADLETVLANADFLSLHCPETPDTVNMIDSGSIALMKKGAVLINTARGTLIDERDVADALVSGKLAGAGLDVLAVEPMEPDNPLLGAPNAIITPHIAWATKEARSRLIEALEANIEAFLEGSPRNIVS